MLRDISRNRANQRLVNEFAELLDELGEPRLVRVQGTGSPSGALAVAELLDEGTPVAL